MVELIPGTTLPIYAPGEREQTEGRGTVTITPERRPPSLLEKIADPDYLTAAERVFAETAIRAFDKRKVLEKEEYFTTAKQTDATTGNVVIPLFEVPQGKRGDVVNLTVDTPGSATITPAAPFTNAASWAYIAVAPASSAPSNATALRTGLVAFAPAATAAATSPLLPYTWTFNDSNAPIAWGGEQVYYVLVGGSIAALTNLLVQATIRVNVYSHA